MVRIIVSGGIGSGKSTVASIMQDRGAAVVHADEIGHLVLEPEGEAFADVAGAWPQVVVNGAIDRKKLAAIVFSDHDALAELESMTHPAIRRKLAELTRLIHTNLFVVEIPVLRDFFDSSWTKVFVVAEPDLRRERLEMRGMDPADIEGRMGAQETKAAGVTWADFVITNDGSVEELTTQVRALLSALGNGWSAVQHD